MLTINFYTKEDCLLCEEALHHLKTLRHLHEFEINTCDIEKDEAWFEAYHLVIPVLEINGQELLGNEMSLLKMEEFITKNK